MILPDIERVTLIRPCKDCRLWYGPMFFGKKAEGRRLKVERLKFGFEVRPSESFSLQPSPGLRPINLQPAGRQACWINVDTIQGLLYTSFQTTQIGGNPGDRIAIASTLRGLPTIFAVRSS